MTDNSITGRDDYITGQALLYAIAHIQTLPEERQERSNMLDMCALARATFEPDALAIFVNGVEHHAETCIDLHFPEGEEATAEDEIYRNDYECQMNLIRAQRATLVKEAVDAFEKKHGIGNGRVSVKDITDAALARAAANLH